MVTLPTLKLPVGAATASLERRGTFYGPRVLGAPQSGACNAPIEPGGQPPGVPRLHKLHKVGACLLRGQVVEQQALLQPEPLAELQDKP